MLSLEIGDRFEFPSSPGVEVEVIHIFKLSDSHPATYYILLDKNNVQYLYYFYPPCGPLLPARSMFVPEPVPFGF